MWCVRWLARLVDRDFFCQREFISHRRLLIFITSDTCGYMAWMVRWWKTVFHLSCLYFPPLLLIASILTSIHLWNWHFNCIEGNSAQAIRLNYCSGRLNRATQSAVLHTLVSAEKVWCFQGNAETQIRQIHVLKLKLCDCDHSGQYCDLWLRLFYMVLSEKYSDW